MHLSNVKNVWNERGETKNEFIRISVTSEGVCMR